VNDARSAAGLVEVRQERDRSRLGRLEQRCSTVDEALESLELPRP